MHKSFFGIFRRSRFYSRASATGTLQYRTQEIEKNHVQVYSEFGYCCACLYLWTRNRSSIFLTHCRDQLVEMVHGHSSNVIIQGSTFNSAQGDIHINQTDSGMHDFRSVQKSILIDDPINWRTSYPETRSFSWSDSWLRRTLPVAKLSPWYPQGRSTDYFWLDQSW